MVQVSVLPRGWFFIPLVPFGTFFFSAASRLQFVAPSERAAEVHWELLLTFMVFVNSFFSSRAIIRSNLSNTLIYWAFFLPMCITSYTSAQVAVDSVFFILWFHCQSFKLFTTSRHFPVISALSLVLLNSSLNFGLSDSSFALSTLWMQSSALARTVSSDHVPETLKKSIHLVFDQNSSFFSFFAQLKLLLYFPFDLCSAASMSSV